MKGRIGRPGMSDAEKDALWTRFSAGESFTAIGRALGKPVGSIYGIVRLRGGIAPPVRRRAVHALTSHEREGISRGLSAGTSVRSIAGWLVSEYPEAPEMRVSHETIYRSLFVQTRGALKRELTAHLRTRQPMRRSKRATTAGQTRGQIVDAVSIAERPACIADRAIPGHWEGDLMAGARNTHIATLVERTSRYVHLVRVTGKDTASVVSALIREVQRLPAGLMASLTWDRGLEMAPHRRFSVATDVAVYFCDPKRPWQRGTNENTNGLLRQYFPAGTDLSVYGQRDLDRVALQLNTRPRKTLGFCTPAAILVERVVPIG